MDTDVCDSHVMAAMGEGVSRGMEVAVAGDPGNTRVVGISMSVPFAELDCGLLIIGAVVVLTWRKRSALDDCGDFNPGVVVGEGKSDTYSTEDANTVNCSPLTF